MSRRRTERIMAFVWPDNPVQRSRRLQVEEDIQALSREEEREELQAWLDVYALLQGARWDRHPLDALLRLDETVPTERERQEALSRLTERWAATWKVHDPRVRRAAQGLAARGGRRLLTNKLTALERGILVALAEAREPQEVRLGRDGVMASGSRIVVRQKKDLDALANGEVTDELIKRVGAPPVGVHAFDPWRVIGPIEGALRGQDPWVTAPIDLRPSALHDWVRRRAIYHAEAWLLEQLELDRAGPASWARYAIGQGEADADAVQPSNELLEIELLQALDRKAPDPLAPLCRRERIAEILEVATPGQREILKLLHRYLAEGLSQPEAIRATAEERRVTKNTIHQTLARIRKRM